MASFVIQGICSNYPDLCTSVLRGESSFLLDWMISILFTLILEWYVVLFKHVIEDLMFMQGEIWFFIFFSSLEKFETQDQMDDIEW